MLVAYFLTNAQTGNVCARGRNRDAINKDESILETHSLSTRKKERKIVEREFIGEGSMIAFPV